jgi:hypothetical protein
MWTHASLARLAWVHILCMDAYDMSVKMYLNRLSRPYAAQVRSGGHRYSLNDLSVDLDRHLIAYQHAAALQGYIPV